jgi:hypothetical protein
MRFHILLLVKLVVFSLVAVGISNCRTLPKFRCRHIAGCALGQYDETAVIILELAALSHYLIFRYSYVFYCYCRRQTLDFPKLDSQHVYMIEKWMKFTYLLLLQMFLRYNLYHASDFLIIEAIPITF